MSAPPVVIAAHGSRDPASARTMRRLADRVAASWPAPVRLGFLDFNEPSVTDAVTAVAGGADPVVVPALLTHAYHGRVDLPGVLSGLDAPTRLASVLGPDPLLVAALRRRLTELALAADGLVLLAAGTSDPAARSTVEAVAAELGRQCGVPCPVGYASASGPTAAQAVVAARARGARRIIAAAYFLAPGRLYDAAVAQALEAGARGAAAPLGDADEVVRLVVTRATQAVRAKGSGVRTPASVA